MVTSWFGLSLVVLVFSIMWTISMPSTTWPNTTCLLLRKGVGTVVMKNWQPFVFGPEFCQRKKKKLEKISTKWDSDSTFIEGGWWYLLPCSRVLPCYAWDWSFHQQTSDLRIWRHSPFHRRWQSHLLGSWNLWSGQYMYQFSTYIQCLKRDEKPMNEEHTTRWNLHPL